VTSYRFAIAENLL